MSNDNQEETEVREDHRALEELIKSPPSGTWVRAESDEKQVRRGGNGQIGEALQEMEVT